MSLKPIRTLLSPPRSSPNISRPRGNHLLIDFWIAPIVISGLPSAARHAARDVAPILREQQVEHLVAVTQLLGHDAQHPEAIFVVLRALQRPGVLLDRAELRRGLGADDGEQMLGLLLGQLLGLQALLLAGMLADRHGVGRA